MASAGQAHAHSSQPMHFSRPSGQRFSWCLPWNRGAVGFFSNGYCSVNTLRNIVRKVTPNPATGSQRDSLTLATAAFLAANSRLARGFDERGGTGKPPAKASNSPSASGSAWSVFFCGRNIEITANSATTPAATSSSAVALNSASRPTARTVATSRIQPSETGIRTFQPSFMNWS